MFTHAAGDGLEFYNHFPLLRAGYKTVITVIFGAKTSIYRNEVIFCNIRNQLQISCNSHQAAH
jgi:hypothetical protein